MNRSDIKVKAYAVFRRDGKILVHEVREHGALKGFRIPGGHVEFGEKAFDAVQREIMEELGVEAENYQPLPVIENIFVHEGRPGHEITFMWSTEFKDKTLYEKDVLQGYEHTNNTNFDLFWVHPENCPEGAKLFPTGLAELLK